MKKYDFKKILIILSVIVLALLSCFLLKLVFPNFLLTLQKAANIVLIPGFIALFISYLVEPITNSLEKRFKLSKNMAVLATIVITIVFLIALFVFIFVF